MTVRSATAADVPPMVEWADRKREEYARAQPRFWRPAQDAAERHRPFLEGLIGQEDVIALVSGGGFAIGLSERSSRRADSRSHPNGVSRS